MGMADIPVKPGIEVPSDKWVIRLLDSAEAVAAGHPVRHGGKASCVLDPNGPLEKAHYVPGRLLLIDEDTHQMLIEYLLDRLGVLA